MLLSRERLQLLTDHSTDIVVGTDRDGTVIYYNDGAKRTMGYSEDQVLGAHVARFYPSLQEAKRVMAAIRGPGHGGPGIVQSFRTTFLARDGKEVPVAISGTLVLDENGEEDGTVGYAKDLRDILHGDQLTVLGEVAIGLSHEINNPLAVILNQVSLLEDDVARMAGERDTSVEDERLDAIRREVARISEILDRLGEMVRQDTYETVNYLGPSRMVDLRKRRPKPSESPRALQGLHVLVVDDDLGICDTLKEILEGNGCEVDVANDGKQALKRIEQRRFDLVLTDVVMPNMDGHDLYLAVRESRPELPVLMMTAFHYDKGHIIKRARMRGLEGVIFKKPLDPDRLCQVIAKTVGRAGGQVPSV
jgi:PAS domain S-box-containing protein